MLVLALSGLFAIGCIFRCISLAVAMAMDTGDKSGYKQQIKHTLLVLVIAVIVAGTGALPTLIKHYFS